MPARAFVTARALAAWVALLSTGCSRGPADVTPEGAVETFLRELDDVARDPRAATRAYALLAPEAREALRLRAERARSITGQRTTPEAMLAPLWSTARFEVDRVKSKPGIDAAHATVDVYGVDPSAQHVAVPVVREGERWRILLAIPPPPPPDAPSP